MTAEKPLSSDASRVCVGVVTGAHGVKGLLRIKPFTETPEGVAAYGAVETEDGSRRLEIEVANRAGKGQVAVRAVGIDDRTAAETLKGQLLFVQRSQLPAPEEDEFYHADLIGLAAQTASGEPIGTVRGVFDFGAGDVLEIADADGRLMVVPFTRDAVPEIDPAAGRATIAESALDAALTDATPDPTPDPTPDLTPDEETDERER